MAKRFTLAEAQRLIPEVDRLLREALDAKSEYQEAEQAIHEFSERVMMMGGVVVDRDRALAARTGATKRRRGCANGLKRCWRRAAW